MIRRTRETYAFIEAHPEPSTPEEALAHVLAVYKDEDDARLMVQATHNIYGDGVSTGLTMGDLRRIAAAPASPSRFTATPTEVDAYLRTILAEDVYLRFQQAIGEHALAEAVEDAGAVRASADNDGLYNNDWREGWDDAIGRIDPDRNGPCPTKLITLPDA